MTQPVTKRADQLVVGDRILHHQLPYRFNKGPAEVRFVADDGDDPDPHTFVAYRYANGRHDSMTVLSGNMLQVIPADPTGLGYSRADDGETMQPIAGRIPPHFEDGRTVVEVAGGLIEVDPPEGFVPASAPECLPECGGGRQCRCHGGWS